MASEGGDEARVLDRFVYVPDECPSCKVAAGYPVDRDFFLCPCHGVEDCGSPCDSCGLEDFLYPVIISLCRYKRKQPVPRESAVFSQDFLRYAVERDGDGPCIFLDCLGWDVFHYAVNHIFPRHFEEVSDPASYVALEYEDVFLGFEPRIGAHVGPVYPSDFVKCQVDRCAVPFRTYPEVPERGGGYEFLGDAPVEECAKLLEYAVHVVASPFPDSGGTGKSIFSAAGSFGSPGIVIIFPAKATIKPAPALSSTSLI